MFAGVVWRVLMFLSIRPHPLNAIVGAFGWGLSMWLVCGNRFAVGLAWRRFAVLPVSDRVAFRVTLDRACNKLRLIVLSDSEDRIVLGPKGALVRFAMQETRVEFAEGTAVVSAPAFSLGAIKKALTREATEEKAGE
jgi:hypothetical protein